MGTAIASLGPVLTARQDTAQPGLRYLDRAQAGRAVAAELGRFAERDAVVVLGIARGGVAVGYEVARALAVPFDVLVVLRLGLPGYEAVSAGAIAGADVRVMTPASSELATADAIERTLRRTRRELERLDRLYRSERGALEIAGRTVILVDDGIASGTTMRAAILAARERGAAHVVVASPVASQEALRDLAGEADEITCLATPEPFSSVSSWYGDFRQVDDAAICDLLDRGAGPSEQHPRRAVLISGAHGLIEATLIRPEHAVGVVVIASGASPRLLHGLNSAGLATLVFSHKADSRDLELAMIWAAADPATARLRIGVFAASEEATSALACAAHRADVVGAVVLESAHVDRTASSNLTPVVAPTLLLSGSRDADAPVRNRLATALLHGPHRVATVVGASEAFEEPGTADEAARLAAEWFRHYF